MCPSKRIAAALAGLVALSLFFIFFDSKWMRIYNDTTTTLQHIVPTFAPSSRQPIKPGPKHVKDEEEEAYGEDFEDDTPSLAIDKEEASDPALLAPRSYSGPYNERVPNKRYMIYSPSGGFSNQRKELEYAVIIAEMLDRVLYVPMCARHTNNWDHYAALKGEEDLFPMDRVIDFPFLSNRLVPLNVTVTQFVHNGPFEESEVFRLSNFVKMYERRDVLTLQHIKQPLLFFRGKGFYHPWFSLETLLPVQKRMRFTQYLRTLAVQVAHEAFGGEGGAGFNAMHIRMGDYSWRRKGTDGSRFVNEARRMKWNLSLPTYIATEPDRDEAFFKPIRDGVKRIMFSNDLPRHLVTKFTFAFPSGRIRADMLGLLEQLICAQAKSFYGTYFSTFSKYISFTRNHRALLFPETTLTVDTSGDVDDQEEGDEK